MSKLLLIDGSSLLHRAFYALPLLSTGDGVFTNAVHGFMMMFNRVTAERRPDYIAVCFDKSRVTFRNQIYSDYKATRSETPNELRGQFELIKEVLDKSGVHWLELENYEADDLLGALAFRGAADGLRVEILSGDRDVLQLINDSTIVCLTKKGISEIECYDEAAVREKYSVTPPRLADLKGLMGDSSDNIPGVAGVGEKTAVKLLAQYGDLETLYAHLDEVSGAKLQEKLAASKEIAFTSRTLATIAQDAPVDADWNKYKFVAGAARPELAALYAKLGMRQLLRGLNIDGTAALRRTTIEEAAEDKPWPAQDEPSAPAAGEQTPAAPRDYSVFAFPLDGCALLQDGANLLIARPGEAAARLEPSGAELDKYRKMLLDPAVSKTAVEAKEIINLLSRQGLALAGLRDDVTVAAYLLDPSRGDYRLVDLLAENGLPAPAAPEQQAALMPELAERLRVKLAETGMQELYTGMEMPLVQVLAEMEQTGIRVRAESLASMSETLLKASDEYQRQIYALAGHEFNLNSPKQLGVVLFEEMGIPPLKKTKTGYSTDAEVLETLAVFQPIARLLLDYRLAAKLRSTYTEGMAKLIAADGKLHTCYKQTVTATGRLSSVEPNLQNIPIRHELGRRIREVFIADQPGDLLLAADYNQIELRVLAHISADDKLRQAYINGEDIHTRTAAEVLGVDPAAVTPAQRRAAKAVNFGIIYGISDYGLSRDLGISRKEAQQYIDKYFARYPDVAAYQRRCVLEARAKGYAETMLGRRRYLPDLASRNFNLRSFAERVALNAPIQGSAADIIKIAMVNIHRAIKERGLRSRMLLQIHDELVFNVPNEEMGPLRGLVREQMEHAVELSLPLAVDMKTGADLYNMEKVE